MSAWYSNIVGATQSKLSNLQRTWLSSEADGDTEDDTHVCRVLRSYYGEKGRPLPNWLPPDPKAPPPAAAVYAQPASAVGSRYGGMQSQGGGGGGGGPSQGGLSSLWDNNPVSAPPQDQQSLRRGRGNPSPAMMRGGPSPAPGGPGFRTSSDEVVQARPLPSQRAGSYQTVGAYGASSSPAPSVGGGGGGSAQDRLKQRLFGGSRTTSPSSGSGPFQPPPPQQSRGGGGDYEDRFGPGGMYDQGGPARRRPGGLPSGPRMR
ncbi:Sec1-binding region of Mso1-domain-containing protein [Xylariomycetidae sp. FL0641]|nr:Sec1-binding region of Mso1-domain-containing protein [Xylariomycetidae sp. FL0641]